MEVSQVLSSLQGHFKGIKKQASSEDIQKWLSIPTSNIPTFTREKMVKIQGSDENFIKIAEGIRLMMETDRGLLLTGDCGTGKTLATLHLYTRMKMLGERRWADCNDSDGFLWSFDKEQNPKDEYDKLFNKTIFIEDFGREIKVNYGVRKDFVHNFINDYYNIGTKRLIVSSNFNSDEMMKWYDKRLVDRLLEMCVVVKLEGKSLRERMIIK